MDNLYIILFVVTLIIIMPLVQWLKGRIHKKNHCQKLKDYE